MCYIKLIVLQTRKLFTAISQETIPAELPIVGEPNVDIFLDLLFPKGPPLFFLNEKKLQLLSPLDRDENNLSHIVFQVSGNPHFRFKRRTICRSFIQFRFE